MLRFKHLWIGILLWVPVRAWGETSDLWGNSGERWVSTSRLPDFSFAGYRSGEQPIPQAAAKMNVKDFGAVGDGIVDDTEAFLKALKEMGEGVLRVPQGRYRITNVLPITRSRVVIRGEGPDKTVLFFPKSLSEVAQDKNLDPPAGSWSWSGAFLSFQGDNDGESLARVTAPAPRGSRVLEVSSVQTLRVGDRIRLIQSDKDGTLGKYLYADQSASPEEFLGRKIIDFSSRITAIQGKSVALDRPLRVDVRSAWDPRIYSDVPMMEDSGVENVTIEFPAAPYAGHHDEPGCNAIEFSFVTNGWVRNVVVVNADNGVILRERTKFCTVQGVRLVAGAGRTRVGYGQDKGESQTLEVAGHHAILVTGYSQDNLIADFNVEGRFIHDVTVENGAAGNVFGPGRGKDLDMDHHRRAPYENLFTDIDAGEGTRLWEHGGDEADGGPAGVRETVWNLRARRPQTFPSWAILMTMIGVTTTDSNRKSSIGNWMEAIPPDRLTPSNLYLSQRALRRLSVRERPSPP